MRKDRCLAASCFILTLCFGVGAALNLQTKEQAPDIGGEWTGTWSTYSPAQGAVPAKEI